MDIQFAYNVERLLYFTGGRNCTAVANVMAQVDAQFNTDCSQSVTLSVDMLTSIQSIFSSCCVSDQATLASIGEVYSTYGYALCPHSALGVHAGRNLFRNLSQHCPLLCVLTAHPSKFETSFVKATGVLPPQLSAHPTSVLSTLPQRYTWLRKDGRDGWRQEWIVTLKAAVVNA